MDLQALAYFLLNLIIPLVLVRAGWSLSVRGGRLWIAVGLLGLLLPFSEALLLRRPELEHLIFPWTEYPWFRGWGSWGGFLVFGSGLHRAPSRNRVALGVFIAFLLLLRMSMWWQQLLGLDLAFDELGMYQGICWQSTTYTCTPAACATLLSRIGIAAGEKEMARLCLTGSLRGTDELRAARGLKLKLGSDWRVRVLRPSREELAACSPCLVNILLAPMLYHTVVLLEVASGEVLLADPSRGKQGLPWGEFARSWSGTAVCLERK